MAFGTHEGHEDARSLRALRVALRPASAPLRLGVV